MSMTHEALMRQATETADFYFISAVRKLDEAFGEDYSKRHPELVAAFMKACTTDYDTAIKWKQHEEEIEAAAMLAEMNATAG